MAERKYNVQNLKPPITTITSEEARKRGSAGGKKSVKVRREKKLLSQIYGDLLADQAKIKNGGGFKAVAIEILNETDIKNNPSRVAIMKEVREATEGSKIKTETAISINTEDAATKAVIEQFGINPKN